MAVKCPLNSLLFVRRCTVPGPRKKHEATPTLEPIAQSVSLSFHQSGRTSQSMERSRCFDWPVICPAGVPSHVPERGVRQPQLLSQSNHPIERSRRCDWPVICPAGVPSQVPGRGVRQPRRDGGPVDVAGGVEGEEEARGARGWQRRLENVGGWRRLRGGI